MKYIVKQNEPRAFTDWKTSGNQNWQPSYSDLAGAPRNAVKAALQEEQGHLCCYCERRLIDADSHIKHFKPQRDSLVDPLDYDNLLCSCQNQIKRGEPRHCGNLKGDWFDSALLLSPLDPGCETRFAFMGDGIIIPVADNDLAAAETIKRLGLDIAKLRAQRAKAIEPFLDDLLTAEEMRIFVTGYLARDRSGQFGEFWTTIRYLFGGFVST